MRRSNKPNRTRSYIRRMALPVVLVSFMGCNGREPAVPDTYHPVPAPAIQQPQLPFTKGPAREPPAPHQEEKTVSGPLRPPTSFPAAMQALEKGGLGEAAKLLRSRVKQRSPKMKLGKREATKMAGYLLADLPQMPNTTLLHYEMPRSTIELVRAVHERGVSKQDAEGISAYLLRFIDSMDFGNLKQLDINHSHVIGREWEQIDYSGERLDPQRQKRRGQRMGVKNFKEARYIHAYFKHASKMGYFKKVYRPNGELPAF